MKWKELNDSPCSLCPRNCLAKRHKGQKGYCFSDDKIRVAAATLHMWEEPCISGTAGSGTVFFSGCSLRCVYCQNFEIVEGQKGKEITEAELSELFLLLQEKGAANINLVTPDHYMPGIARAVLEAKEKGLVLPVIFNGSGYEKEEMIRQLSGIVDIFLTDFKYMETDLAARFSAAPDYPEAAVKALKAMTELAGEPVFDENGMMKRGVIVRHLLLPGHKRNAKEVLRYVYETYGNKVYISLMNQYTPFDRLKGKPGCEELLRKVTKREYEAVVDYALSLGIENAFIQEGHTASESFIPDFDGGGFLSKLT